MMSEEQFERMMNRLDTLIKITAINAFQGRSRVEVVLILASLGFSNTDIAMILGTTPAYVAAVKYQRGKETRKKQKPTETNAAKEVE